MPVSQLPYEIKGKRQMKIPAKLLQIIANYIGNERARTTSQIGKLEMELRPLKERLKFLDDLDQQIKALYNTPSN